MHIYAFYRGSCDDNMKVAQERCFGRAFDMRGCLMVATSRMVEIDTKRWLF